MQGSGNAHELFKKNLRVTGRNAVRAAFDGLQGRVEDGTAPPGTGGAETGKDTREAGKSGAETGKRYAESRACEALPAA